MLSLKKYLALSMLSLTFLNAVANDQQESLQAELVRKHIKGIIVGSTWTGPSWSMEEEFNAHDDEFYSPRYPQRSILCRLKLYSDLHESLNKLPENPDRKDLKNCCENNTPLAQWPAYLLKKLLNMGILDDLEACDANGNLVHSLPEKSLDILKHMIKNDNI